MKLVDKYKAQLAKTQNQSLIQFLQGIDVVEYEDAIKAEKYPTTFPIVVGRNVPPYGILNLLRRGYSHFVQDNRDDFFSELFAATLMMRKPEKFMQFPIPFFIRNFKEEDNMTTKSAIFDFRSSADKMELVSKIELFVRSEPATAKFLERILIIADEMIANALYNAPVDNKGAPKFKHLPRNFPAVYPENAGQARIFLMRDEEKLVIGCSDPYGSVAREPLIRRLMDVYEGPKADAMTLSGSGLGVKMIIDNSVGVHLVVSKGQSSLFCASLPLKVGNRAVDKVAKNFHFCFYEAGKKWKILKHK